MGKCIQVSGFRDLVTTDAHIRSWTVVMIAVYSILTWVEVITHPL